MIDDYLLEGSLAKFVERAEGNAPDAARQLISELFVAYAQSEGKLGWVEMTPRNLASARPLYSLFPNMKLVDVMRDGRDVAASLVGLGWKRDPIDALKWWEGRIQQGYRSTRLLPATCHFVLQFEDLVNHRRHETLDSLFSFLGWSAPAEPLAFMEHHVTPDRAHVGRWQHDFDDDTQKRVTAEYQAALDRLGPAGVLLP